MRRLTCIVVSLVLALAFVTNVQAQDQKPKYRFVMVSHIGSNDPNMKWLTLSLKAFEKKYPDVKTEYLSTNEYSLQKLIQLTEQAIATDPDGLAVPIVNAEAMAPVLKKAMDKGIPVVAFNLPDSRPKGKRIPYLTYVGGDLYQDGVKLGQYALDQAKAGKVPMPKKMVCATPDAASEGLKARCRGMHDVMAKHGVDVENLFISGDPAKARNILGAYLSRHRDVNYAFVVASAAAPWVYGVADELGLDPKVDDKGFTEISVDASPVSLAGVQEGKLLAANSQGFWLQGYVPMEWLYWYHEFGYKPQSDVVTGPTLITPDNVDKYAKLVRKVFGDETYDSQNTW